MKQRIYKHKNERGLSVNHEVVRTERLEAIVDAIDQNTEVHEKILRMMEDGIKTKWA